MTTPLSPNGTIRHHHHHGHHKSPSTPIGGSSNSNNTISNLTPTSILNNGVTSSNNANGNEINQNGWRLAFGTIGIYAAFIYYGSLQEDVYAFTSPTGAKFDHAWFLLALEAVVNILVAMAGRCVMGGTPGLPMKAFAVTGASQVFSKAFTGLSLSRGLSFPVATLAKSGKMAPVMLGQLVLGGTTYSVREYMQVGAIIGGTALLSLCKVRCEFVNTALEGLSPNALFSCTHTHSHAHSIVCPAHYLFCTEKGRLHFLHHGRCLYLAVPRYGWCHGWSPETPQNGHETGWPHSQTL